jgi:hypothetical protein
MNAREHAEQKQHEYAAKMMQMKAEKDAAVHELEMAKDRIHRLEYQICELNEVKLKYFKFNYSHIFRQNDFWSAKNKNCKH